MLEANTMKSSWKQLGRAFAHAVLKKAYDIW